MIISTNAYAAAPTRGFNYVSGSVIDPAQNNSNENSLFNYLQNGVDTYANGSISNVAISSTAAITYSKLNLTGSIIKSDLSASITFVLPSGAAFFMFSGSCPSGTTDVSSTLSNKYIKINSTAGTLSGVVLTGTTDSHVLTTGELPSSGLTFTRLDSNGSGITGVQGTNNGSNPATVTTSNMGTGGGHTHTISGATTLEPSSVTAILCQVN